MNRAVTSQRLRFPCQISYVNSGLYTALYDYVCGYIFKIMYVIRKLCDVLLL